MLDDSLESLCRLLTNEVDEGCKCGPKFLEQVTRAFGIAIVRQLAARQVAGTRSGLDGRIERAIQFIQENFRGRISVADMARAASLSTFHFSRRFSSAIGVSPHEYLIQHRLRQVQHLIRTEAGLRSLSDIAIEAGFSDLTHMARHFRRVFGKSPAQYLRQQ
jgi:transcriptional regulator GlxA family with amidase domain